MVGNIIIVEIGKKRIGGSRGSGWGDHGGEGGGCSREGRRQGRRGPGRRRLGGGGASGRSGLVGKLVDAVLKSHGDRYQVREKVVPHCTTIALVREVHGTDIQKCPTSPESGGTQAIVESWLRSILE